LYRFVAAMQDGAKFYKFSFAVSRNAEGVRRERARVSSKRVSHRATEKKERQIHHEGHKVHEAEHEDVSAREARNKFSSRNPFVSFVVKFLLCDSV
jgi:hypothetical protein